MASEYGYITVANLENKSGIDYSVRDAAYTDTIIEMNISTAERFVRTQLTDIPATATDGMVAATLLMSERFMHILMVKDGYVEPELKAIINFFDYTIRLMLNKDEYQPCGPIPMQGIDR